MPIEVTCSCGARLRAGDAAAGKLVKCPKCASLIPVPKPADPSEEIIKIEDTPEPPPVEKPAPPPSEESSATKTCPECGGIVQTAAVICRHCRHNLGPRPGIGVGRTCVECNHRNPPGSQLCEGCGAPLTRAARMNATGAVSGRRDLRMEGHLSALGLWYRINAVLGIIFTLIQAIAVFAGASMSSSSRGFGSGDAGAAMAGGMCGVIFAGGIHVLTYLLGHHLSKLSNAARIIAGVLTSLAALAFVCVGGAILLAGANAVGGRGNNAEAAGVMVIMAVICLPLFAWTIAVLWALFNSRAAACCTDQYKMLVAQTPGEKPQTFSSPFFWIPLILLVLGIGVLILAVVGTAARL